MTVTVPGDFGEKKKKVNQALLLGFSEEYQHASMFSAAKNGDGEKPVKKTPNKKKKCW